MPTAFIDSQRSDGSADVMRKRLLGQARHGAVVEQLAVLVAPAGVIDLADRHLEDVARGHLVQQARGVRALDDVFHQRRDVDQRRRVADRPVLAIELELVGADDDVPGPAPPILREAQARRALVEGRAFELERFKHVS